MSGPAAAVARPWSRSPRNSRRFSEARRPAKSRRHSAHNEPPSEPPRRENPKPGRAARSRGRRIPRTRRVRPMGIDDARGGCTRRCIDVMKLCLRLQHGSSVRGWGLTSSGRGMGARAEGVDRLRSGSWPTAGKRVRRVPPRSCGTVSTTPRSRVEPQLSRDGPTEPERSGRHADDGPGGPPAAAGAPGSDPERNGGRRSRPARRGGAVAGGLLRGVGAGDGGDGAQGRALRGAAGRGAGGPPDSMSPPASCVRAEGYSLPAGVRVAAGDRPRLEKRCRYVARPAQALDRRHERTDGRFASRVRPAWSDGTETLIFEPETLIEKLVALVPRPNGHLTRFHGVGGGPAVFVEGRDRSPACGV